MKPNHSGIPREAGAGDEYPGWWHGRTDRKGEDDPRTHEVVNIGRTVQVRALDLELSPDDLLAQIDQIASAISGEVWRPGMAATGSTQAGA